VIGTPAELDAASLDDIKRFFLRWYAPNNATLVVVGDIDVEATLGRIHHWFDAIPRAPDPPQIPAIPPPSRDKAQRIVVEADVSLPRVLLQWATPAWGQPGEPALASAATLAEWTLSGYVVKKLELAHSVNVEHRPGRVGSTFSIDVSVREGVNVEKVLEEVSYELDEMSRYARYWVDDKRVRESLYNLYAGEILDFDGLGRRARVFGVYDVLAGSSTAVADRLRAYEGLDSEDVVAVYRDYIVRVPPVIAIVRPNSSAPVAGKVVSQ
jgi:zinc protease